MIGNWRGILAPHDHLEFFKVASCGCLPCTDYPDDSRQSFCKRNNQKPLVIRMTDDQISLLPKRILFIIENSLSLIKADSMFFSEYRPFSDPTRTSQPSLNHITFLMLKISRPKNAQRFWGRLDFIARYLLSDPCLRTTRRADGNPSAFRNTVNRAVTQNSSRVSLLFHPAQEKLIV